MRIPHWEAEKGQPILAQIDLFHIQIAWYQTIIKRFFLYFSILFLLCFICVIDRCSMLCSVSSVSPNTHKQVHCSLPSTVPFTVPAGGDLCIYRDCEQWKTLIRCHVLHRPWSRLKEAFKHVLQNSSLSVGVCVCMVPKGPVVLPD